MELATCKVVGDVENLEWDVIGDVVGFNIGNFNIVAREGGGDVVGNIIGVDVSGFVGFFDGFFDGVFVSLVGVLIGINVSVFIGVGASVFVGVSSAISLLVITFWCESWI